MSQLFCGGISFILLFANCIFGAESENYMVNVKPEGFEPNWTSLDLRPLPTWYDEAKVGIIIHWGVYSVPTQGTEWFWTNWRNENVTDYVNYMNKNYKPGFTYQEFANDFTAEQFDANEWAKIFEESGAKYVVLVSKHHDGYALWPSKYSFSWNSVDIGPHRDIVKELAEAVRANTSMKFGLYHSLFEWFHPLYLEDRRNAFKTNEFVTSKILPEMKELVENYRPEVLWSDGDWEAKYDYWNSTEFLAWLYNFSPVKTTVVTNDRWGIGTLCEHGDFYTCKDRYNPGVLQPHKWENVMSLDKYSWGNRANARLEDYYTSKDLIKELATTISCGGNILINVGPTKSGLIDPIFVERLRDMGKWLGKNGEAIYNSRPWVYQNDTKTPDIWYTSKIEAADRITVYAIVLNYPYDADGVELYAFGDLFDNDTEVTLLGFPQKLKWYGSKESMYVQFPQKKQTDKLGIELAWTLKINIPRKP